MNLDKLQAFRIPDAVQTYTWRDSSLYALGLGYGADPVDEPDLRYVLETDQQTVPSMDSRPSNLTQTRSSMLGRSTNSILQPSGDRSSIRT